MDLKNKNVAITGAAQGLGQAMAVALVSQGVNVFGIDMNPEKLEATAKLCQGKGGEYRAFTANVSDEQSVSQVFREISKACNHLDGLVNNAGITRDGLLLKVKDGKVVQKMELSQWQAVIDVNLTGVFLCTREAAALMIEQESPGVIINISSISRSGNFGQTNYTAAKAGVASMTVTWAKELAKYGIRVAAIAPGYIATEMTSGMKPEALAKMTSQIPANRLGQPSEIAGAVQFILMNDYFNGRVLECDGGLRI